MAEETVAERLYELLRERADMKREIENLTECIAEATEAINALEQLPLRDPLPEEFHR